MKSVADMTIDEFRVHMEETKRRVFDYKSDFYRTDIDRREIAAQTRRYGPNCKRGNFQGKLQKTYRQQLKTLSGLVASGGGKYE